MPIRRLSAVELAEALKSEEPPLVVDVREPWELELAALPGALNLPLGELAASPSRLDPDREIVLLCHHGVRSMHAAMFLAHQGFERLCNLQGGIEAWSLEVDPSVPRY